MTYYFLFMIWTCNCKLEYFDTIHLLFPLLLGDDGPQVKKPSIDIPASQANNIVIPAVGTADPQAIAQAAIAK